MPRTEISRIKFAEVPTGESCTGSGNADAQAGEFLSLFLVVSVGSVSRSNFESVSAKGAEVSNPNDVLGDPCWV